VPELPDVELYLAALRERVQGETFERARLASPFLLRSVDPPLGAAEGKRVRALSRLGKRIVLELEDELFLVVHLMIAGRFQWKERDAKVPGRVGLAAFDFSSGTLILTEASKKRRASLHVVRGRAGLAAHDPGGRELADLDLATFRAILRRENHTLKRALTDPRGLSGIGGAYSDEIMHRARISPLKWTSKLTDAEFEALFAAARDVLDEWTRRLDEERAGGFPAKVTAFRPEMAVHGKFGEPCPACGHAVQRIAYASNETNYCAFCQTGGKLLADRALSKLLKDDWPKTLEDLEELRGG
jgi:formamidopyrimidine-DNA glycosylase